MLVTTWFSENSTVSSSMLSQVPGRFSEGSKWKLDRIDCYCFRVSTSNERFRWKPTILIFQQSRLIGKLWNSIISIIFTNTRFCLPTKPKLFPPTQQLHLSFFMTKRNERVLFLLSHCLCVKRKKFSSIFFLHIRQELSFLSYLLRSQTFARLSCDDTRNVICRH
jgi:hypothetical protein